MCVKGGGGGVDGSLGDGALLLLLFTGNEGSLKIEEYEVRRTEMSSLGTLSVGAKTMLTARNV